MISPLIVYAGGWWTERHVGDDAILRAHLAELRRHAPAARPLILGPSPEVLRERFGVEAIDGMVSTMLTGLDPNLPGASKALAMRALSVLRASRGYRPGREPNVSPPLQDTIRAIAEAKAVVIAGAGSLTSELRGYGLWPLATTAALARLLGTPTVVSGIGAGPFVGLLDRFAVGLGLRGAKWISVRDRDTSRRRLRRLLLRCDEDWDDAAWLPPAPPAEVRQALAAAGVEPGGEFAAVTVAATRDGAFGLAGLSRAAECLQSQRGLRTVAIPMDMNSPDRQAIAALQRATRHRALVTELWPLPSDAVVRGVFGAASVSFGGRYHGALFSALEGTPALLNHADSYQRGKALGLAGMASDRVRPIHGEKPFAVAGGAIERLDRGRSEPIRVTGPLRAAAWAARQIVGRD
jgi:polysaccharide pyruvyl transferase WcaK-like protein